MKRFDQDSSRVVRKASRTFDSVAWRTAETAMRIGKRARRRWLQRDTQHDFTSDGARVIDTDQSGDAEWALRALQIALAGGAYQAALLHRERLLSDVAKLSLELRTRALPLVVESLLAHGERERAESVASEHAAVLARSARGASVVATLAEVESLPLRLPNGQLNALLISRLVKLGALEPERVVDLLLEHPLAVLKKPQLHLLVHTAYHVSQSSVATTALNRFLRSEALPVAADCGATGNLLRDISFTSPPRTVDGPLVSVIMSAFNAAETIEYAVESLKTQTHRNLEILICDDGSTDGTPALLRDLYGSDSRVRLFVSGANQGPYNIRNHLLDEVRGELITFHDADDVALPTRIEMQVARLRSTDAVASLTKWVRVKPDGTFVFFKDQAAVRLALVSMMARKHIFEMLGRYRPAKFAADFEFYESLRARYGDHRIDKIQRPLLFGLWSEASLTRQQGAEALEDGYRAPRRRLYSELLFRQRVLGKRVLSEQELSDALAEGGVLIEPHGVTAL